MMPKSILVAAAAFSLTSPLFAQPTAPTTPPTQPGSSQDPGTPHQPLPFDRGYDKASTRTDAINTPNRGELNAANAAQAAKPPATVTVNPSSEAQYQEDMTAYTEALRAHGRAVAANDAHYMHQQRAYADAMRAWRIQVADCHHGVTAACKAPPPDPADFY